MRSVHYRILRSYKDTPHGPSDRIRTCGILLPKQARYHLRYTRLFGFYPAGRIIAKQPRDHRCRSPAFFAALRLLLRRGQPYQYNGLQGESQPAPAAVPPRGKAKSPTRRPLWDTWQPSVLILFHPVSLRKNPMVFTNIMQNNNFVLTLRKYLSVLSFFGGFFLFLPVFRQRISAKTD